MSMLWLYSRIYDAARWVEAWAIRRSWPLMMAKAKRQIEGAPCR